MSDRTNEEWLADLSSDGQQRALALEDLRVRLERGLYYYLRNDRSDLSSRSTEDIRQMAQDFTQEALLKVLDKYESFRGESKFTTWATKVAARVAISELRRVRYKNYSLDHLTSSGETMPVMSSLAIMPENNPRPESYAEQQEIISVINEAFDAVLTEKQKIALKAYIMDDVPVEEIAHRLNTNRNALYKLVHDARVKLKKHMEQQGLSLDYVLELFDAR